MQRGAEERWSDQVRDGEDEEKGEEEEAGEE